MIFVEVMISENVINEVIIICFFENDASMKIKHSDQSVYHADCDNDSSLS